VEPLCLGGVGRQYNRPDAQDSKMPDLVWRPTALSLPMPVLDHTTNLEKIDIDGAVEHGDTAIALFGV
jgi:hypothetical protein